MCNIIGDMWCKYSAVTYEIGGRQEAIKTDKGSLIRPPLYCSKLVKGTRVCFQLADLVTKPGLWRGHLTKPSCRFQFHCSEAHAQLCACAGEDVHIALFCFLRKSAHRYYGCVAVGGAKCRDWFSFDEALGM